MRVWTPLPDRAAARAQLGFTDKFVIGINAANQDPVRKGFGEQLAAFRTFSARHDDAIMLIHSRAETRQGANLMAIVASMGLEKRVVFGDQYLIATGLVGEQQMVAWHSVLDVLSNCSYGEGFGLAVLQSQACGTPVIVTDFSAMSELCGAGWKVKGQPFWNRGHNASWLAPSVPEIVKAYEKAYDKAASLRGKAAQWAQAYDADRVLTQYWKPVLDKVLDTIPPGPPAGWHAPRPATGTAPSGAGRRASDAGAS
jgi:glycosyltransferase involved in cell wall biosynthesis